MYIPNKGNPEEAVKYGIKSTRITEKRVRMVWGAVVNVIATVWQL